MSYTAFIRRLRGLARFARPCEAFIIDFNRRGMNICLNKRCVMGDKVAVTIKSPTEEISGIRGRVCYVRKQGVEYWLGIRFIDVDQPANAETSVLAGLEKLIKNERA